MNNKKNKMDFEKLPFETEEETDYRKKVSRIMMNMSVASQNIETELKNKTYNFKTERQICISEFEKLKNVCIPQRYNTSYAYTIKAFNAFFKALDIMDKIKEDNKNIIKAYKYIDEWCCWVKLSSIYIFISFENVDTSQ
jgi:DNA gyrase/topoisomerase IV subunit A